MLPQTTTTPQIVPPPSLNGCEISTPLWRLLSGSGPADLALADIAADDGLRQEAARVAPVLARLAEPSGEEAVRRALQPLVLVFGVGEAAKSPAYWAVYVKVLAGLPMAALARAVSEYPQTGKFFPKPAEIKELAVPHAAAIRQAAARARTAARMEPERPADPPEVRERVKAQFNALLSEMHTKLGESLSAKAAKRRVAAAPQASVDETGLSPELRALAEEQGSIPPAHGEAA